MSGIPSVPLSAYQNLLQQHQQLLHHHQNFEDFVNHPEDRLESWFSALKRGEYRIAGNLTFQYNCIAWAAGTTDIAWWPVSPGVQTRYPYYWPPGVPTNTTIDAFVEAFQTIGYEAEPQNDSAYNVSHEKIAIYTKNQFVCHAARLLRNGRWSSKIGVWERVEHGFDALCGNGPNEYGQIVKIMRRRKKVLRMITDTLANKIEPVLAFLERT
jgi:hypothetical protein